MAGEWIKVQANTIDKPEVIKMARIIGIDKDSVLGKLVRVWCWFDENSVDGVVDGVVAADIDAMVLQDGFSDAMKEVGWLESDDKNEKVWLPNFDHHNGETAKSRALKNKRQARWRKNSVDVDASTKASTREEKRREDIYRGKKFTPPTVEEVSEYCAERKNGIDAESFVDFYSTNGWVQGHASGERGEGVMEITYEKKGDKYIFCKDGVYFSLTLEQVSEMGILIQEIYQESSPSVKGDMPW